MSIFFLQVPRSSGVLGTNILWAGRFHFIEPRFSFFPPQKSRTAALLRRVKRLKSTKYCKMSLKIKHKETEDKRRVIFSIKILSQIWLFQNINFVKKYKRKTRNSSREGKPTKFWVKTSKALEFLMHFVFLFDFTAGWKFPNPLCWYASTL